MERNNASTLASPEQLIRIINEDNELLPKSKRSLINLVRVGNIETIEKLNDHIRTSKRLDGTTTNSTIASTEQLIRIINEDNELLPKSKRSLINLVRVGNIETIEKLNDHIRTSKRLDGTASNSTIASTEQLIRIINEDNELLPKSKRSLTNLVRVGNIETIEKLNDHIRTSKRLDGTASNSTLTSQEQLIRIINEDNELLPGSKRSLTNLVRVGNIETIEKLNDHIRTSKRLDGTTTNSTIASTEQLIRIINEDNELLPGSKRSLINLVRVGNIETIEKLNDHIRTSKRLDGHL